MATIQTSIRLHDGMTSTLNKINGALNKVTNSFSKLSKVQEQYNRSIRGGSSAANGLWSKLKSIFSLYMGIQAAGGIIKTADELTMTTARLNLMTGSLEETKKVQDQIYQSAMRSRAGYLQTADAVAKLRLRAGQIFKTNDEAIAFSETLNKMFAIAGASQSEMYSATLQLTQALGSGVLRGEEFRAVFEAAPNVMQAVADYMNLPIGKLREIANEGAISADIVKKAMFKAAEQVDKQFKEIPYTWRQVWTLVKNHTIKATEPLLERIRNITKSERFIKFADMVGVAIQKTADSLVVAFDNVQKAVATCFDFIVERSNAIKDAFSTLGTILSTVWNWVVNIANFMIENWSYVAPIIWGIIATLLVLKTVMAIVGIISAVTALINLISWGWVVLAIIGVVVAFYWVIAAINDVLGTSYSATAILFGLISYIAATLINCVIVAWNAIAWLFDGLYNFGVTIEEVLYNAFNGGFTGWIDGVKSAFWSFVNWIYGLLEPLVKLYDKFMETNHASAIQGWFDKKIEAGTTSKYKKFERRDSTISMVDANGWAKAGYNAGKTISNIGKTNPIEFGQSLIPKDVYTPITTDLGYTPIPTDATKSPHATDIGKALSDGFDTANPLLDKIAGSTGDISSSLNSTDEDLSYMRDLAEREAINRYTLTDLKVEQNNNNNFANGVDANSMLDLLKRILHEGVQSTANGVHI